MREAKACRGAELAENSVRRVSIEGRAIALVRCGGQLYALADSCPHKGGYLSDGHVHAGRGELICPWHRFRFRLSDGASVTNPEMRAHTYPVREQDGDILIGIG